MKVLYVEDDPIDAELTRTKLARIAPHIELEIVHTKREALARLKDQNYKIYDLVLADMKLPDGDGRSIVSHIRGRSISLPVIMVTGSGSQETAVTAIKAGADDYIVKRRGYLEKLPQIIDNVLSNFQRQAFQRAKPLMVLYAEDNLQEWELTQKHFLAHAPHIQLTLVNSKKDVLEYLMDQDRKKKIDIILLDYKLLGGDALEILKTVRSEHKESLPVVLITGQGDEEVAVTALKLGANDYVAKSPGYLNKLPFVIENAYHFTEMIRQQKALKASEEKFALTFHTSPVWVALTTLEEGRILEVNETFSTITGYTKEEAIGHTIFDLGLWVDLEERVQFIETCKKRQGLKDQEVIFRMKSGELRNFSWSNNIIILNGTECLISVVVDITKRKKAEEDVRRTVEKLRKATSGIVQTLSMTVETRDPYTAGHQRRVADLARAIAQEMGFSRDFLEGLHMAGLIHDVGKISIPAEILSKPIPLSDIEFSLIKNHSQSAYDILKEIDFPWPLARIILQHHERMDGSGYPLGLKGEDILLEARILAVADVVEAMASHRPYRPTLGIDKALEEISLKRDCLYDPQAVDACLKLFKEKGFRFE
ncbi:MAG: response regulator [Deltaproteobacteria bacterium]|nr:response regulator [Deltaproteobacteria bacterium]